MYRLDSVDSKKNQRNRIFSINSKHDILDTDEAILGNKNRQFIFFHFK